MQIQNMIDEYSDMGIIELGGNSHSLDALNIGRTTVLKPNDIPHYLYHYL